MSKKWKNMGCLIWGITALFFVWAGWGGLTEASGTKFEGEKTVRIPAADPTNRVWAQNRFSFHGYPGTGVIVIENHGLTQGVIYVNGQRLDTADLWKEMNGRITLDIGRYTRKGNNSVKVEGIQAKEGYMEITVSYPELKKGTPAETGFSEQKLQKVDELIQKEVEKGFPGAVLLVVKDGKIIKNTAYGYRQKYEGDRLLNKWLPMEPDTVFDLASNTKPFATVLAMMKLTGEGQLQLEDRVSQYLPGFTGEGRELITVRDLLEHRGGLAPEIKFFDPVQAGDLYSVDRNKTEALLCKAPIVYTPGSKTVYSDTGFMILGSIVEKVTGQRLDQYVEKEIYEPLGLAFTKYNPLQKGIGAEYIAATERNGNTRDHLLDFSGIRHYTLKGEVHDEKAFYSMEGIAGHAGLFSRSRDLAVLAQLMINGGGYGSYRLCDADVLEKYLTETGNEYIGGWDRGIWLLGPYAGSKAIGHSGWVGTATCIDRENDMAIILLTNKVHSPYQAKEGRFEGNVFETGKYGSIMSLVYEALLEN